MEYILVFLAVIFVNVVPAFAPSTWTVLAGIAALTHMPFLALTIVGALGALMGRILLAKMARSLVRNRLMSEKTKHNIDALKVVIEQRKKSAIALFLLYSFGPLPSNQLFIAYGLTDLPIRYLAAPFFVGRLVSYGFWTFTGSHYGAAIRGADLFHIYGWYFIGTQILTLLTVYLFTKVPWRKVVPHLVQDIRKQD